MFIRIKSNQGLELDQTGTNQKIRLKNCLTKKLMPAISSGIGVKSLVSLYLCKIKSLGYKLFRE